LGRSRGGFSTKIHVSVSGLGLPVEIRLTPGQEADVKQGELVCPGFVHTAYHYYTIRSELALTAARASGHNSMCQNSIKTLLRAMKRALKKQ
jgi:hypothetical protein